jgi:RNA polymerase sigma-54 factor
MQELGMTAGTAMLMKPSPALVSFATMLALPSTAMEERIEQELAENPALERDESRACPLCGRERPRPDSGCRLCWSTGIWEAEPWVEARARDDQDGDGLEHVPEQPTAAERLRDEARLLLVGGDQPIVEYLIGSLDDHGRLDGGIDEIAATLAVEPARVTRILRLLQRIGPPGIGARSLRECLLLQLDRLEETKEPQPLVREILERHLAALARGRTRAIVTATGRSEADVIAARDFIRANLHPYAIADDASTDWPARRHPPCIRPDVIILERSEAPGELEVVLVEPYRFTLTLSRTYQALATNPGPISGREHALLHLGRARCFQSRLQERWRTIHAITEHVAARQREFLRKGAAFAEPMTRVEVAQALGMHESTVSRAVAGKYAQIPSGRVIPMADFFEAALGLREALKQVIAAETRPLSDAELAQALAQRGHRIARRTVAKHRGELGIPAHPMR